MEKEDRGKSLGVHQGQETAEKCDGSPVEGNGQDARLDEDAAGDAYMSDLGDIGNVDLPDIDLDLLDFLPSDEMEETRYMLPHVAHYDPETFVLYDNAEKLARNPDHPTMKPVPLIGRLIANSSRRGDTVLDIFGGSGTTLIAAEQLHRKCRMVEFEPIYVDVIIKRWEELTGAKACLVRNIHDNEEKKKEETDNAEG